MAKTDSDLVIRMKVPNPGMDRLAREAHEIAANHGFWDHLTIKSTVPGYDINSGSVIEQSVIQLNPSIVLEKLALIHSEVSEALEAFRDNNIAGVEEELADVIIRVLDLADHLALSMDHAVTTKIEKNRGRPRMHGRSF